MKRSVAFFLSVSFTLLNCFYGYAGPSRGEAAVSRFPLVDEAPSQALPKDLAKLNLPAELGTIQEIHQGTSDKTVIYLQDAHAVYEAQKSIQRIIDYFQNHYGLNTVALEGGTGRLDPFLFRTYPEQEILKQVFDGYLQKGELSGAAAAAVLNQKEAGYWGLEDRALYEEGILAFLAAEKTAPVLLRRIARLQKELDLQKDKIYPPKLLELDQALKAFYDAKADLIPLLQKLKSFKEPLGYPHLEAVVKEMGEEGESSEERIRLFIQELIKSVKPLLQGKEDLMAFNEKKQAYETSRLSSKAFSHSLLEWARSYGIDTERYGELERLSRHWPLLQSITAPGFFKELESYIEKIKSSLYTGEEAKALDRWSNHLILQKRLARFELTRDDWKEIETTGQRLKTKELTKHLAFYEIALKREAALLDHLKNLMGREKTSRAIFISGGFHAPGMTESLKEAGISYVLIAPRVSEIPDQNPYLKVMKGEVSWRDYFRIEKGRVNLYESFNRATMDRLIGVSGLETRNFLLKNWRDEIIRTLAGRGEIENAGRYTRFFDSSLQAEWRFRVDRFLRGLKRLVIDHQLTEENLLRLFRAPASATLFSVMPLIPDSSVRKEILGLISEEKEGRERRLRKQEIKNDGAGVSAGTSQRALFRRRSTLTLNQALDQTLLVNHPPLLMNRPTINARTAPIPVTSLPQAGYDVKKLLAYAAAKVIEKIFSIVRWIKSLLDIYFNLIESRNLSKTSPTRAEVRKDGQSSVVNRKSKTGPMLSDELRPTNYDLRPFSRAEVRTKDQRPEGGAFSRRSLLFGNSDDPQKIKQVSEGMRLLEKAALAAIQEKEKYVGKNVSGIFTLTRFFVYLEQYARSTPGFSSAFLLNLLAETYADPSVSISSGQDPAVRDLLILAAKRISRTQPPIEDRTSVREIRQEPAVDRRTFQKIVAGGLRMGFGGFVRMMEVMGKASEDQEFLNSIFPKISNGFHSIFGYEAAKLLHNQGMLMDPDQSFYDPSSRTKIHSRLFSDFWTPMEPRLAIMLSQNVSEAAEFLRPLTAFAETLDVTFREMTWAGALVEAQKPRRLASEIDAFWQNGIDQLKATARFISGLPDFLAKEIAEDLPQVEVPGQSFPFQKTMAKLSAELDKVRNDLHRIELIEGLGKAKGWDSVSKEENTLAQQEGNLREKEKALEQALANLAEVADKSKNFIYSPRAEVRTVSDPKPLISIDQESHGLLQALRGATPESLKGILDRLSNHYLAYRNVYLFAFREELRKWIKETASSDQWGSHRRQAELLLQKIDSALPPPNEDSISPPYSTTEAPKVVVIIPVFKRQEDSRKLDTLRDNLHSLQTLEYPREKLAILIVDDGSPDRDFADELKREFPQTHLLRLDRNVGYVQANNQGIETVIRDFGADYFFLINDDTYVVDPKILTKLVRALQSSRRIGFAAMPLVNPKKDPKSREIQWVKFHGLQGGLPGIRKKDKQSTAQYEEIDAVAGSAYLVSKALIEKAGPMDPRIFIYWDETEWQARAWRKEGFRSVLLRMTRMVHKEEGGGVFKPLGAYYLIRNAFLYAYEHREGFYGRYLWPFFVFWEYIFSLLRGSKAEISGSRSELVSIATRGLIDGILKRWNASPRAEVRSIARDIRLLLPLFTDKQDKDFRKGLKRLLTYVTNSTPIPTYFRAELMGFVSRGMFSPDALIQRLHTKEKEPGEAKIQKYRRAVERLIDFIWEGEEEVLAELREAVRTADDFFDWRTMKNLWLYGLRTYAIALTIEKIADRQPEGVEINLGMIQREMAFPSMEINLKDLKRGVTAFKKLYPEFRITSDKGRQGIYRIVRRSEVRTVRDSSRLRRDFRRLEGRGSLQQSQTTSGIGDRRWLPRRFLSLGSSSREGKGGVDSPKAGLPVGQPFSEWTRGVFGSNDESSRRQKPSRTEGRKETFKRPVADDTASLFVADSRSFHFLPVSRPEVRLIKVDFGAGFKEQGKTQNLLDLGGRQLPQDLRNRLGDLSLNRGTHDEINNNTTHFARQRLPRAESRSTPSGRSGLDPSTSLRTEVWGTAGLSAEELELFQKTLPQFNWKKANEVPWEELVRDPYLQPKPRNTNQRNYFKNQWNLRADFLRLLFDIATGKIKDLTDFQLRFSKLNEIQLLGRDGRTLYISPTYSLGGRPVVEARKKSLKTTAGKLYRGEEKVTKKMEGILKRLKIFLEPDFLKGLSFREKVNFDGSFYIYLAGNWNYLFFSGNNSLAMNLVNGMLRLMNLNGIAHRDFDAMILNRGMFRIFRAEFLKQVKNANRSEVRASYTESLKALTGMLAPSFKDLFRDYQFFTNGSPFLNEADAIDLRQDDPKIRIVEKGKPDGTPWAETSLPDRKAKLLWLLLKQSGIERLIIGYKTGMAFQVKDPQTKKVIERLEDKAAQDVRLSMVTWKLTGQSPPEAVETRHRDIGTQKFFGRLPVLLKIDFKGRAEVRTKDQRPERDAFSRRSLLFGNSVGSQKIKQVSEGMRLLEKAALAAVQEKEKYVGKNVSVAFALTRFFVYLEQYARNTPGFSGDFLLDLLTETYADPSVSISSGQDPAVKDLLVLAAKKISQRRAPTENRTFVREVRREQGLTFSRRIFQKIVIGGLQMGFGGFVRMMETASADEKFLNGIFPKISNGFHFLFETAGTAAGAQFFQATTANPAFSVVEFLSKPYEPSSKEKVYNRIFNDFWSSIEPRLAITLSQNVSEAAQLLRPVVAFIGTPADLPSARVLQVYASEYMLAGALQMQRHRPGKLASEISALWQNGNDQLEAFARFVASLPDFLAEEIADDLPEVEVPGQSFPFQKTRTKLSAELDKVRTDLHRIEVIESLGKAKGWDFLSKEENTLTQQEGNLREKEKALEQALANLTEVADKSKNFLYSPRAEVRSSLLPKPWYDTVVKEEIPVEETRTGLTDIRKALPAINDEIGELTQEPDPEMRLQEDDLSDQMINQYLGAVKRFNEVTLHRRMTPMRLEKEYLHLHQILGGQKLIHRAGLYDELKDPEEVAKVFRSIFSVSFNDRVKKDPVALAAYVFVRLVNLQPFHDGNKRAASLILNYILIKSGYQPFILDRDNAAMYTVIVNPIREENEILETEFRAFLRKQMTRAEVRSEKLRFLLMGTSETMGKYQQVLRNFGYGQNTRIASDTKEAHQIIREGFEPDLILHEQGSPVNLHSETGEPLMFIELGPGADPEAVVRLLIKRDQQMELDNETRKKLEVIDEVMRETEEEIRKEKPKYFEYALGGNIQYRGIPIETITSIVLDLKEKGLMTPDKKFGDIGAGIGRALTAAVVLTPVGEALGIEMDPYLVEKGKKAIDRLDAIGILDKSRIRWIQKDWHEVEDEIKTLNAVYIQPPMHEYDFEPWADWIRPLRPPEAYLYDVIQPSKSGWGQRRPRAEVRRQYGERKVRFEEKGWERTNEYVSAFDRLDKRQQREPGVQRRQPKEIGAHRRRYPFSTSLRGGSAGQASHANRNNSRKIKPETIFTKRGVVGANQWVRKTEGSSKQAMLNKALETASLRYDLKGSNMAETLSRPPSRVKYKIKNFIVDNEYPTIHSSRAEVRNKDYVRFNLETTIDYILPLFQSEPERKELPSQPELSQALGPSQPTFSNHSKEILDALRVKISTPGLDPGLKRRIQDAIQSWEERYGRSEVRKELNQVAERIVPAVLRGETPSRSEVKELQEILLREKWDRVEETILRASREFISNEAYAAAVPELPVVILSIIRQDPIRLFEILHETHGFKEKVPTMNQELALALDARLIPESGTEQENILGKGLTGGYLVLGYHLGAGSIEAARKNQLEAKARTLQAEIRSHFRLHGYVEEPRYEELQGKIGRDADRDRMITLWADGNLRIPEEGKGRALAFVIDPEVLATLKLGEIISILQIIASAPPELKNFYLNSLDLTPRSDGLSYLSRDFVNALTSLEEFASAA